MGYDVVTLGITSWFRAEGLADSLKVAKDSGGEVLPKMVASNVHFPVDDNGELTPTLKKTKGCYGLLWCKKNHNIN